MSYNKKIKDLEEKKAKACNRYWENVKKKMKIKCFFYCDLLKKEGFYMDFPHSIGEYDEKLGKFISPDFVKDNELLIGHYAEINGLEICDEMLLPARSIYYFKKMV